MSGASHSGCNRGVPRIAILTSDDVAIPSAALELLRELDCEVNVCTPADATSLLPEADVCFVWDTSLSRFIEEHWDVFGHLSWIHIAETGVDSFLFPALTTSEVVMTNASGIYNESIAEFVAFRILSFAKQGRLLDSQQRSHRWNHIHSGAVKDSRAVIYGVGSIGTTVGSLLAGLHMCVRGVDPSPVPRTGFEMIYPPSKLRQAAGWADHLVVCVPLTPQTRHSIDADVLRSMRPGCHLVNVGRGPVIDEEALIGALGSGSMGGASLDVFEQEPLAPDSPLWDMENVQISPHISGDAGDFEMALCTQFVDLVRLWIQREPFPLVVDKEKGYAVRAR